MPNNLKSFFTSHEVSRAAWQQLRQDKPRFMSELPNHAHKTPFTASNPQQHGSVAPAAHVTSLVKPPVGCTQLDGLMSPQPTASCHRASRASHVPPYTELGQEGRGRGRDRGLVLAGWRSRLSRVQVPVDAWLWRPGLSPAGTDHRRDVQRVNTTGQL